MATSEAGHPSVILPCWQSGQGDAARHIPGQGREHCENDSEGWKTGYFGRKTWENAGESMGMASITGSPGRPWGDMLSGACQEATPAHAITFFLTSVHH